jgi:hypothetical protein
MSMRKDSCSGESTDAVLTRWALMVIGMYLRSIALHAGYHSTNKQPVISDNSFDVAAGRLWATSTESIIGSWAHPGS